MVGARRPRATCVVSPHHVASDVGADVLRAGGNAVDAAVATSVTLAVLTPYHCGPGGDLLALVWNGGRIVGYRSTGRSPLAATRSALAQRVGDTMPRTGPHTVTVPGTVQGWFDLLDRYGSRSFGHLARAAIAHARDGFVPSEEGLQHIAAGATAAPEWRAIYGAAAPGRRLRQPDLARTLETLAREGPDALYRGRIGEAVIGHLTRHGGLHDAADLAAHAGAWIAPLTGRFGDLEVFEHPPPTQGVTALEAMAIAADRPAAAVERTHLLIEATRLALADRDAHVSDPDAMHLPAQRLLSRTWIAERRTAIRPDRAADLPAGLAGPGDTAFLAAADGDGMLVSLIQSNYQGFGSGLTVPGWGLHLHNRGASFTLDRDHVNVVAPRKLPRHTLIPALVTRNGEPALVLGTMGGDGQAQIHLQVLDRFERGEPIDAALGAARWIVSPHDGAVAVEDRLGPDVIAALGERGHRVAVLGAHEHLMGHAHAIVVAEDGYIGATDPRTEGGVA